MLPNYFPIKMILGDVLLINFCQLDTMCNLGRRNFNCFHQIGLFASLQGICLINEGGPSPLAEVPPFAGQPELYKKVGRSAMESKSVAVFLCSDSTDPWVVTLSGSHIRHLHDDS